MRFLFGRLPEVEYNRLATTSNSRPPKEDRGHSHSAVECVFPGSIISSSDEGSVSSSRIKTTSSWRNPASLRLRFSLLTWYRTVLSRYTMVIERKLFSTGLLIDSISTVFVNLIRLWMIIYLWKESFHSSFVLLVENGRRDIISIRYLGAC